MYFHWQNLNEKPGGRTGSPLKHGRAWWRITDKGELHWEWVLRPNACAIGLTVGGEDGFGLHWHVGIPLIGALYVSITGFAPLVWLANLLLPRTEEKYGGLHGYRDAREICFRVHDWTLWWTVWRNSMAGWSRKVPRWRDGNFKPLDVLLGDVKFSKRTIEPWRDVEIPMPERAYKGRACLEEFRWKRPRWFARTALDVDIKLDQDPIPCPGKGENSWDIDTDATFGFSCRARNIEEAIGKLVESCLVTRRRRGAPHNWTQRAA